MSDEIHVAPKTITQEFDEAWEAERPKLLANLAKLVDPIVRRMLPDVPVRSMHSAGYCEDGETYLVMIELVDGTTLTVSATPGEPVAFAVHGGLQEEPR